MEEAIQKIAESKGWTIEEAKQQLLDWWKAGFKDAYDECKGDLNNADEEYQQWLLSAFDIKTRRPMGSGKGDKYVGMIVAYKGKRDSREDMRQLAQTSAMSDLDSVLKNGIRPYRNKDIRVDVCRAFHQDGSWKVVNANDQVLHTVEGLENDIPPWAIAVPNEKFYVAMLNRNGKPMDAYAYEKSYLAVVNTPDKFLKEGPCEPVTLKCVFDAGEANLRMNVPIQFNAERIDFQDGSGWMLKASSMNPDYSLNWVSDEHLGKVERMFDPAQYLPQFVPYLSDLANVFDYHEENCTEFNGRPVGPVFALKGTVEYIDYVGREFDWVEGGIQYSMRVSSNSMRREDANGAIFINVSKHMDDTHHAFKVMKDGEWKPYTTGTQVIVVAKSRTYDRDDGDIGMNLDAYNVYAIPSRAFIGEDPSDDSNDLGGLDGFRGDGA